MERSKGNAERNDEARHAVTEAVFSLMNEGLFSSITVTQVVRRAHVARATFYRNFDSKEQVLSDYIDGLARRVQAGNPEVEQASLEDREALARTFERSFAALLPERNRICSMVNAGFTSMLQQMMDGYAAERLGSMPTSSPERYTLYFVSGAIVNVLVRWLSEGAKESPQEMGALCARLVAEGVAA